MAELSVLLTAKITDLKKQLKIAEADLLKTGKVADNTSKKVANVGSKGMKTLKKSTVNATPAVLEFNRTIQDAPFGIQGVANNIQQLTANFGDLTKKTGSAKLAVKAMASSLLGPQGILLLVSVATALMVAWQNGMFKTKSAAEKLNDVIKKNNESLQKYIEGLRGAAKATLNSQKSSAKELITLGHLRNQIEDTTNSIDERKDAVEKLQKKYPAYFKNITQEQLLNGQAASSYDTLTNSILKRAKATAATQLLVKNAKKEFDITAKLADLREKAGKKRIEIAAKQTKADSKQEAALGNTIANTKILASAQADLTANKEEQLRLENQISDITKNNLELEAEVTANIVVVPKIDPAFKLGKFLTDSLPVPSSDELADAFGLTNEAISKLGSKADKIAFDVSNKINAGWDFINPNILKERLTEMELAMEDFNNNMDSLIQGGLTDVLAGLGEAIGTSLIEGGNVFDAIGKSLLGTFGHILSQLGQMMIQMGLSLILAKSALKSLNPVAAIAGGVALLAIGSAFSSSASSLGSGSSGGVGGQGSSSSSVNTSSTGGGTSFSNDGTVVFEIAGTKLIGVLKNTQDRNLRLGG